MSEHTTADGLSDASLPFGAYAPEGVLARIIARTRRQGTGWLARRVTAALRRVGMNTLGERPADVEALGARMRVYPQNNLCDKRILFTPQLFDVKEREILGALIEERLKAGQGFRFVDIGANVGAYSLFVAARAGQGARITAVEPQPDIFARLTANIGFNPFGTVKAVACALADKPGELTLFLDPRNKGESSVRLLRTSAARAVKVPAMTLEQLLADEGYPQLDAIKIDVEGAEDLIIEPFLRSAPQHLWPTLIIIEDSANRWQVDLRALFRERGYREIAHTHMNFIYRRG